MKVAIQGERGSFSHQAALELAPRAEVLPCTRSIEVFDALESGRAGAAVIPVENTLAGPVGEHLDLLCERDVYVHGELHLRIEHNLIAAPNGMSRAKQIRAIRQVLSHPVALDQCRNFFRHHRGVASVGFYDTAGAVKYVMTNKVADAAAIASRQAAREYGGRILQAGLEDDRQNFTRFFLVKKTERRPKIVKGGKTSLVFSVKNVPGALFKALSAFALRDLDLSKIESRPVRGKPWEYMFFVDVVRGEDEVMHRALKQLQEVARFVKVLGIYPKGK
jgi:prephenate dehydratase